LIRCRNGRNPPDRPSEQVRQTLKINSSDETMVGAAPAKKAHYCQLEDEEDAAKNSPCMSPAWYCVVV
jgi:hypothetical protein